MTTPLLGYDTSAPEEAGLYRTLTIMISRVARERGLLLNCSGGVGDFKRKRGAVTHIEYNAVYTRHLPWWRRVPWNVAKFVGDRLLKILKERNDI